MTEMTYLNLSQPFVISRDGEKFYLVLRGPREHRMTRTRFRRHGRNKYQHHHGGTIGDRAMTTFQAPRTPKGYSVIPDDQLPKVARTTLEEIAASVGQSDKDGKVAVAMPWGNWHLLAAILDTIAMRVPEETP